MARLDVAKTLSGGANPAPEKPAKPEPPAGKGGQAKKKPEAPKIPEQPVSDDDSTPLPNEHAPEAPRKNKGRVAVPMPEDMRRDLAQARVDDGIEATVRIRAMVELWQKDIRLRRRIDKLARVRSAELIAHRWPADAE